MNKKFRIVKITFGDKTERFEVQKKTIFGKWVNAMCTYDPIADMTFPLTYDTIEEAENAYYCSLVNPIIQVVKEL